MEFYTSKQEIQSSNCVESEFNNTGKVSKRKRTKRQRPHHTPPPGSADSASTSATSNEVPAQKGAMSASTSSAGSIVTAEEEDMANCLMLLAKGGLRSIEFKGKPEAPANHDRGNVSTEKFTSRRTEGKAGLYVYECKTCNRSFPSFQALGGHRTSHKKPKLINSSDDNKQIVNEEMLQISMNSFSKSLFSSNSKAKVHECSLCGAEFNSGQALGGHMRRHRPIVAAAVAGHQGQELVVNVDKEKNMFSLDLNLPAPAFDDEVKQPETAAFDFVTPWLAISY